MADNKNIRQIVDSTLATLISNLTDGKIAITTDNISDAQGTALGYHAMVYTDSSTALFKISVIDENTSHPLIHAVKNIDANAINLLVQNLDFAGISVAATAQWNAGGATGQIKMHSDNHSVNPDEMRIGGVTSGSSLTFTVDTETTVMTLESDKRINLQGNGLFDGTEQIFNVETANKNIQVGNEAGLALAGGTSNTLVGHDAGKGLTTGNDNIVLGENGGASSSLDTENFIISIGNGTVINSGNSILLGHGAANSVAGREVIIGGNSADGFINEVYIGRGFSSTTGNNIGMQPTVKSGTDQTGNTFTIRGGAGTGTGAAGKIQFQVAQRAASTSSTVNTYTTLMTLADEVGIDGGHLDIGPVISDPARVNIRVLSTQARDGMFIDMDQTTGQSALIIDSESIDSPTIVINSFGGANNNPHILFTGNSINVGAVEGDFWKDGDTLNFRNSTTTINLLAAGLISDVGTNNIFVGNVGNKVGNDNTVLGDLTIGALLAGAIRNVVIGSSTGNVMTDGDENTVIGYLTGRDMTSGSRNILIGARGGDNLTTGTDNIMIGINTLGITTMTAAIAIGNNIDQITSNTVVIGGFNNVGAGITRVFFGKGEGSSSPQAIILALTGEDGADTAGVNFTIQSGNGRGIGGSGNIIFQTAPVAGSGGTPNVMIDRIALLKDGGLTIFDLDTDPTNPANGSFVQWQSDGTGTGSDGDWIVSRTTTASVNTITNVTTSLALANSAIQPNAADQDIFNIQSLTVGSTPASTLHAVSVTVADTDNLIGLMITQSDITNNPTALDILNAGTGVGLFIDQNGNGTALSIDSEATTIPAIVVNIVDGDSHIRLEGTSANNSPTSGDFWVELDDSLHFFNGTDFNITGGLSSAREVFFTSSELNVKGDYLGFEITTNAQGNFTFQIPADFNTLTSLEAIGIPDATFTSQNIDLHSDYAAIGETFNLNSEDDVTNLVSGTINEILGVDISSVFASIAGGDLCGILIDHQGIGAGITYLGIRLKYSI